jgi:hypothetical protein
MIEPNRHRATYSREFIDRAVRTASRAAGVAAAALLTPPGGQGTRPADVDLTELGLLGRRRHLIGLGHTGEISHRDDRCPPNLPPGVLSTSDQHPGYRFRWPIH